MNRRILKDYAEIELNPKIYPLSVVFKAAYVLTERAYMIVDGDPKTKLVVKMKAKKGGIAQLTVDFNDQLLNYSVYENQSKKNANLREEMLKRALLTNIKDDYKEDKDQIFVPWEEKYG